jgi:hypothetical protein
MSNFNPVAQLKASTTATRVTFHWLGMTCRMEEEHKNKMTQAVDAESDSVNITKRLYNSKLSCLKEVSKIKNQIKEYWERVTLPYVEPGVRLLKRASLTEFHTKMTELSEALNTAAQQVQTQRDIILNDAKQRLNGAFNPANYPEDLATLFSVEWSFPSIEPPNYLATMNPAIYEQEKQRAAHKLEEAIALAEQAFLQEFKQLVEQLHERLTPSPSGEKKIFRDTAITNFTEFFTRFKQLNVGNNQELDTLVNQANELMCGIQPSELRQGTVLRQEVQTGLAALKDKLAPLIIAKPRRNIIRKKEPSNEVQLQPTGS